MGNNLAGNAHCAHAGRKRQPKATASLVRRTRKKAGCRSEEFCRAKLQADERKAHTRPYGKRRGLQDRGRFAAGRAVFAVAGIDPRESYRKLLEGKRKLAAYKKRPKEQDGRRGSAKALPLFGFSMYSWKRWKKPRKKLPICKSRAYQSVPGAELTNGETPGWVTGARPPVGYKSTPLQTQSSHWPDTITFRASTSNFAIYTFAVEPPCAEQYARWRERSARSGPPA